MESWWCSQTDLAWSVGPTLLCPCTDSRGRRGARPGLPKRFASIQPCGTSPAPTVLAYTGIRVLAAGVLGDPHCLSCVRV